MMDGGGGARRITRIPLATAIGAIGMAGAVARADAPAPAAVTRAAAPAPRYGVLLEVVGDVKLRGAAVMIGGVDDLTDRVEIQAGALLGPTFGGYLGSAYYLSDGALRPRFAVGLPIFVSSGVRVGVRGAVGVEWRATRHVAVTAELGVEHYLDPNGDIAGTTLTPTVGVTGRL
jgi:hypothetical protein